MDNKISFFSLDFEVIASHCQIKVYALSAPSQKVYRDQDKPYLLSWISTVKCCL